MGQSAYGHSPSTYYHPALNRTKLDWKRTGRKTGRQTAHENSRHTVIRRRLPGDSGRQSLTLALPTEQHVTPVVELVTKH